MRRMAPLIACLILNSCGSLQSKSSARFREQTQAENGGIIMALTFRGREFPYWMRHDAEELFFARLGPRGEIDSTLIPANFGVDGRLYALDVPPGRYAVVAASYFTGRTRQLAKFNGELARRWAVEVKPGRLSVGGVIEVGRSFVGWDVFLLNGLRRAVSYLPPFRRAVIEMTLSSPRLDASRELELESLRLAREDLKGTAWKEMIDKQLRELGNPPEPFVKGLLRKKAVAAKDGGMFNYVETFDWNQPRTVAGGLEWAHPGSRAWISVAYASQADADFKSVEATLADLRQFGSGEDRHAISEVYLSSRPAYSARYTTFVYPKDKLVGSDVRVLKTEAVVVPASRGYYKLQYRAEESEFPRRREDFLRFVEYLEFKDGAVSQR